MRLLYIAVLVGFAIATFGWGRTRWAGLFWLVLLGTSMWSTVWRVRLDREGVTLWFPFRRAVRYDRDEVGFVLKSRRAAFVALKGRGRRRVYSLPGMLATGVQPLADAVEDVGYTMVARQDLRDFVRRPLTNRT
jgi:hypothetical protein